MNRTLVFFVALALLFSGVGVLWCAANYGRETVGSVVETDEAYTPPEKELTSFEFTDQYGQPFGTEQLAGQVWLGSFFFADCPSICPQQNAEIAKLHQRFIDEDVLIVNITVTPDKDPPHRLLLYANRFDANHDRWKFLTGKSLEYVRQVGLDIFGLPAADETHTSDVAVFDRQGNIHGTYNVNKPVEFARIVSKIEELLAQPAADQANSPEETSVPVDQSALTTEQ